MYSGYCTFANCCGLPASHIKQHNLRRYAEADRDDAGADARSYEELVIVFEDVPTYEAVAES